MILRIATEGQYELKGAALQTLDEMDDAILAALEKSDAPGFQKALEQVLDLVRAEGTRLPDVSLMESDLILPPPDITLAQARALFTDYPRNLVNV